MNIRRVLGRGTLVAAWLAGPLALVIAAIIVLDPLVYGPRMEALTNVQYPAADGAALSGYLAGPALGGPHPAVIMIHEWWGINQDTLAMADRLAGEGYVVLAPDAYRGKTASTVPRALWLRLTVPPDQVAADIEAAYDYLVALERVDAEHVAAVGFCFGGGESLRLGMRHAELAATVTLYGDTVSDPAALGALPGGGPLLGIYGASDRTIPTHEIEAFKAALTAAGVEHEIRIYPDVGHAFVQPDAIDTPGAARDAWQYVLDFLAANLKAGS